MPANALSRLIGPFKEFGAFNGTLYAASRLLQMVSAGRCRIIRYLIVAQPIAAPDDSKNSLTATTVIEQVSAADPRCLEFPRPRSVIEARFAAGHRCLVASVKGKFAGFIWIANDFYDEDEVRCRFVLSNPAVSVWDFDVYVEPQYRIGRTFSRLWEAANRMLAAEGVLWSFSRISSFNMSSIRSHSKLGMRFIHSATFVDFWNTQIFLSSRRPYLSACRSEMGKPDILLTAPEST